MRLTRSTMKRVRQNSKQVEKEEFESSRKCDEETEDVKVFQGGSSSSSSVAVPTAGRIENEEGDGLNDSPQVVVAPVFPVDTLLEEIGLKIFGMLSDEDVASCFRAYPKWQQWLMNQRTRFLFPEVAPFLLQWLPKSALLECRKVCKTWKEGLDNAYISHPERLQIALQSPAPRVPELINRFRFAREIRSFLDMMEFHPGNPFVGRTIKINWTLFWTRERLDQIGEEDDEGNVIRNNMNQLLDRFGQHVFFLEIYLEETDFIPVEEILRECLLRLPNLRRLKIHAEEVTCSDRIQEYYRVYPLPQLLHLQTLVLYAPDDITNAVLESSCVPNNIKQLCVSDNAFENAYGFYEAIYNFKNLEVLDAVKRMRVEVFERLMQIPPPLKNVRLYVHNIEDNIVDFQRFFTTLEVLADSLEFTRVQSKYQETVFHMGVVNNFRINLPKLKHLKISGYEGPFDSFLQLKSLTYLEILFAEMWEEKEESDVQVYGFGGRMELSNIWTLLPTLRTLVIMADNFGGFFKRKYKRISSGQITSQFFRQRRIGEDTIPSWIECEEDDEKESEDEDGEAEIMVLS